MLRIVAFLTSNFLTSLSLFLSFNWFQVTSLSTVIPASLNPFQHKCFYIKLSKLPFSKPRKYFIIIVTYVKNFFRESNYWIHRKLLLSKSTRQKIYGSSNNALLRTFARKFYHCQANKGEEDMYEENLTIMQN